MVKVNPIIYIYGWMFYLIYLLLYILYLIEDFKIYKINERISNLSLEGFISYFEILVESNIFR